MSKDIMRKTLKTSGKNLQPGNHAYRELSGQYDIVPSTIGQ